MSFWTNNKVVVTGGGGFLGRCVVRKLNERGCTSIFVPRQREYDLRRPENVARMYRDAEPDTVIHLAAVVGGIGANKAHPGSFFYDNLMMGVELMEQGRQNGTDKFVAVGSICAYPKNTPVPFREEDLWAGYPEETNAPYGLAKKMLLVQAQAYREEYGFNAVYLLPVNLYGPDDNFDLETSHVIPAMIRKFISARDEGHPEVVLWGDGSATREFLYVEDAAEGILLATECYDDPDPINLGSGEEISIRDLASVTSKLTGYEGRVQWDTSRPNGQPRRQLDVSRARERFGFVARTTLADGLKETVSSYEEGLSRKREMLMTEGTV
jgi:GDP-L-fucose synthase